MKTGIVNSSQLAKHNRWDARFHLMLSEISDQVEKAKRNIDRRYVLQFLAALRAEHLSAVDVLARGSYPVGKPARRAMCEEYPYISFVLVYLSLGDIRKEVLQQITDNKRYLDKIKAMEPPVGDL